MIKMVIGIADCINDESINLWKHQQCKKKTQYCYHNRDKNCNHFWYLIRIYNRFVFITNRACCFLISSFLESIIAMLA